MTTTKEKFTFKSTMRTGLTTWSKEKRHFTVWIIEHEGEYFCEFDEAVKKQDVERICKFLNRENSAKRPILIQGEGEE